MITEQIKIKSKVKILDAGENYIHSVYLDREGIVIEINETTLKAIVQYSNGIKVHCKLDNLKVV